MQFGFAFFFNSILMGVGLAMDAFSVSLANGLRETSMKKRKILLIAGTFAVFQALMPMIGWLCVHTLAEKFEIFQKFIPWIALALLLYIGIGMIKEGREEECSISGDCGTLRFGALIMQGIATSIDALTVGVSFSVTKPIIGIYFSVLIIGVVTFILSTLGVKIGNVFGSRFKQPAEITGGVILILIGIKILLEHLGVISF